MGFEGIASDDEHLDMGEHIKAIVLILWVVMRLGFMKMVTLTV